MSAEEDKLDMAMGGVTIKEETEELCKADRDFLDHLTSLGFNPEAKTPAEIEALRVILKGPKGAIPKRPSPPSHVEDPVDAAAPDVRYRHQYPKFSIFYGDEGKGEVNWDTFKFEVDAALHDRIFNNEQILFGVRRCLKGSAGDKLRRLGPDVTIQQVLEKLESAYGTVETKESIMKRFYTCEQKEAESVETFASRLEELFDKAVLLKALRRSDTEVLKQVLHSGLRKDLKNMSVYQCDKIKAYDDFKRELRRIEVDLKIPSGEQKPCKPVVSSEQKESSDVLDLLKKINERIDKIEANQKQPDNVIQYQSYRGRGSSHGHRGRGRGRGRGGYMPTCFVCNQQGHKQFDCPTIVAQLFCSNCKQKGHIRHNCPTLSEASTQTPKCPGYRIEHEHLFQQQ